MTEVDDSFFKVQPDKEGPERCTWFALKDGSALLQATKLRPFICSALGTWKAQCLVHRRHSANASLCLLYAPSLWLSLISSQRGPWAIWSLRTGPYQQ